MKIYGWLVLLVWFAARSCPAQNPPPNDNFSNRTVLSGTDVTFTGTLAGATVENNLESSEYFPVAGPPTQSVWWTWTAPASTMLTLQILDSSLKTVQPPRPDALIVYQTSNSNPTVNDLVVPVLGDKFFDLRLPPVSVSIPVVGGNQYQIQLIGSSSATYVFRLLATNTPIVLEQPKSRAVFSDSSALFYVVAGGNPPPPYLGAPPPMLFSYQWRSNGVDLAGEIGPTLLISNIDATMAANYSVVVSNANGFTVSQPATLSVSQSNIPIVLQTTGYQSNTMTFQLTSENGRSYRIQSSTDLINWTPEMAFAREPLSPNSTSVIFNPVAPLLVTVTNNLSQKFYRATPYVVQPAAADLCVNQLDEIRVAKLLWARDYDLSSVYTPGTTDLMPYFARKQAPACPSDTSQTLQTSYSLRNLQTEPACYIHPNEHLIEEAR